MLLLKTFLILSVSLILGVLIGVAGGISVVLYRPICDRYEYTQEDIELVMNYLWDNHDPYIFPVTNEIYKEKIDKLLIRHDYELIVKDLTKYNVDGVSMTLLNRVYIDDDVKGINYCMTLCHEILHYVYSSDNERYISFMTFKVLYESNDSDLRNASMKWAYDKLKKINDKTYDCKDLLINYFKEIIDVV